jgi:hypothetical protein
LLEVRDLEAKVAETDNIILRGVNLTIREGEVSRMHCSEHPGAIFRLPAMLSLGAWSSCL